ANSPAARVSCTRSQKVRDVVSMGETSGDSGDEVSGILFQRIYLLLRTQYRTPEPIPWSIRGKPGRCEAVHGRFGKSGSHDGKKRLRSSDHERGLFGRQHHASALAVQPPDHARHLENLAGT